MDKYTIKLYTRANQDLDKIYDYIAHNLSEPGIAKGFINDLKKAVFSLEQFPERGSIRRIGAYANGKYIQLFVKNHVIVYRVLKEKKEVHIVTIRYAPSQF